MASWGEQCVAEDGSLSDASDVSMAAKFYEIQKNRFAGSRCSISRQDKRTYSIMWEGLLTFDLEVIDEISGAGGDRLEDLKVWGVGYAAQSESSDKWDPLCLEIVLRKAAAPPLDATSGGSEDCAGATTPGVLRDVELPVIEDKNIRRIIRRFMGYLECGDRPDLYRHKISDASYIFDSISSVHMVMIPCMPTVTLSFLCKMRHLFSGSLQDVVFERRRGDVEGKYSDKDSATVMVVKISSSPTRLGKRRRTNRFEPYSQR